MKSLPEGIRRVFRLAAGRSPIEEDTRTEIEFHLEMRAAELMERGWPAHEARAEASRRFGDTTQWSEAMSSEDRERETDTRRAEWVEDLWHDLRYGARGLLRTPVFTVLAITTLALGIGANAAVFSVVKAVLLDPLPYADAGRLVEVYTRFLDGSLDRAPVSAAAITDVRQRTRSFSGLAAHNQPGEAIWIGDGSPQVVSIVSVDPDFFPTLGIPLTRGRNFGADDLADTGRVAIIDHALWQRLFAGSADAVGRSVRVDGIARTIIGVLPPDFVMPGGEADVYLPFDLRPWMAEPVNARRRQWFSLVGRVSPAASMEAAQREVASIGAALAQEHPDFHGGTTLAAVPMRDAMVGDTRTPLMVLMASAGLVLLITCANLAGALLSRTLSRRREFAVRVALGAGRGRLVRQLLTESMLVALAGGAAGLALAEFALAWLRRFPLPDFPAFAELSLDSGAVAITALVALAAGLAFGLVPAFAAARSDVQGTLREEGRSASEGSRTRHLRGALVAGQIALCVSLLAGAGLLVRSLQATMSAPLGFNPDRVLAVSVQLPQADYPTSEARLRFIERFQEGLRTLPGVAAVASSGQIPSRAQGRAGLFVDGDAAAPAPPLLLIETSDDYFRTLGIPLLSGRTFGPSENGTSVAFILSESAARIHWPRPEDAVGQIIRLTPEADGPRATVIGVVGDVRTDPASPEPEPVMYMSQRQAPQNGPVFLVRAHGDAAGLVRPARELVSSIDPGIPLHEPATLRSLLADGLADRRLPVVLMSAFGVIALVLASVGVYALFATMVAAREREFGIRLALGASPAGIARLVLQSGALWMAAGLAGGAVGVLLVTRLVRSLLYGTAPFDPVSLGAAVLILGACASAALLVPIRRARGVDPISALK